MHKTPIKFRFITGAAESSLKPLSLELQKILKFLTKHFRNYCKQIAERTGISCYFSIDGSRKVTDKILSTNKKNTSIFCADFTSLFTNLPHETVKRNLGQLINLCFNNSGKQYINTNGSYISYTDNASSKKTYKNLDVYMMLEFILDNSYAEYAGQIYRQTKGIPQGNNASPQIADLTLSYMEYIYITKTVTIEKPLAMHLNKTFRYIDDLIHISHLTEEFVYICKSMYHESLTLERTNIEPNKANFLDLVIEISENRKTKTKLYNKTDEYKFRIVRYPHITSEIPLRIGLNTHYGECVRIFRTCTEYEDFIIRLRQLSQNYKINGYNEEQLRSMVFKVISKNPYISSKYGKENWQIIAATNYITQS